MFKKLSRTEQHKRGPLAGLLTFIAGLACAAMLAVLPTTAEAQTYGATTIGSYPTGTNVIGEAATTNQSAVIDCRYIRNVSFQISGNAVTNATTITLKVLKSLDNVTYENTGAIAPALNCPANGVAASTNINYDVGAVGYLKVSLITIGSTAVSNTLVQAAQKPPPN